MNRELFIQIARFILLVLLQGLVFINIDLFDGKMQAYVYVLFIILLPLRTSALLTMVFAFLIGSA